MKNALKAIFSAPIVVAAIILSLAAIIVALILREPPYELTRNDGLLVRLNRNSGELLIARRYFQDHPESKPKLNP